MQDQALAKVTARLGEPVEAAALVNRRGTVGTIIASTALRLAADGHGSLAVPDDAIDDAGTRTPLPFVFLVAVTSTRVHVFAVRMIWGRLKVKDELGSVERAGLQLTAKEDGLATVFHVRSPGRLDMSFEILSSAYATDFATALGATVVPAPGQSGPSRGTSGPLAVAFSKVYVALLMLASLAGAAFTAWYFFFGEGPGA